VGNSVWVIRCGCLWREPWIGLAGACNAGMRAERNRYVWDCRSSRLRFVAAAVNPHYNQKRSPRPDAKYFLGRVRLYVFAVALGNPAIGCHWNAVRLAKFFSFGNGLVFRTANYECIGAVWVRGRPLCVAPRLYRGSY